MIIIKGNGSVEKAHQLIVLQQQTTAHFQLKANTEKQQQ